MDIFTTRRNYVFDFENQDLNIPVDDKPLIKRAVDFQEFVTAYIAVAGAQLFDSKKTIYKYVKGDFGFDVYFEQPQVGLIFVKYDGEYSDDYLEKLRVYCDVYHIKLGLIYLNSAMQVDDIYVSSDGIIYANISGREKIDVLMLKINTIMKELLRIYLPKLASYSDELKEQLDRDLCKKLAILFSVKKK